jgi:hypothetical protein
VPHADEIILLNEKGQVRDTGLPKELNQLPDLSRLEAKRNLEHNAETFQAPELRAQPIETIIATTKLQADSTRRLGDPALYKFYARAAGWLTLTTFCVAMAIFAFCGSFGSKVSFIRTFSSLTWCSLCRYLAQMVGGGKCSEAKRRSREMAWSIRSAGRRRRCGSPIRHVVRHNLPYSWYDNS